MQKKLEIDLSINTAPMRQSLAFVKSDFEDISKTVQNSLGKSLEGLITGSKNLRQVLREIAADIARSQIQNIISPNKTSGLSGVLSGAAKFAGFFSSGGVVPGSFSQSKPIVAHGSEMVLNPSQQSNLFNMINSGGQKSGSGEATYVYAPNIQTGASSQEVFEVLNKHSSQFFSMVAEGVHTNTNLRNAVKSV